MNTNTKNSCKTAAVVNLLSRGADRAAVPAEPQAERTIETITAEILDAKRVGGEAILTIGRDLIEAKAKLEHGAWLPWLTEKVQYSERTAQNFMRLARDWSNPQALADLGATKALELLALPEEERDAFMAGTHNVDGQEKTVIDMSARELERAIREREEALAEKKAAEEARAKMAEDMRLTKALLDTAQAERDTALSEAVERQGLLRAAELESSRLAQELEELKNRPVEVAVQVDQQAVEKARAEAVAEMQKKLDKAKAEQDKASKALKEAEEKRQAAEAALAEVNAKLAAAKQADKPSPITADSELAQFKLLFEQAQGIVNQMHGLLLKVRKREDGDAAGRLENALRALAEKVGGAAQ